MKKPFLHGLKGKAHWRLNRVIFSCFLFMVLYEKIGFAQWSIHVADGLPNWSKYLALMLTLFSVGYMVWRIQKGAFDNTNTYPKISKWWFAWNGVILISFAVISANNR